MHEEILLTAEQKLCEGHQGSATMGNVFPGLLNLLELGGEICFGLLVAVGTQEF